MSYDQFSVKVGEYLGVDPTHIRFSTMNVSTNKPKLPVKRSLNQTLWQILSPQFNTYNANQRNDALFYEVMDMSLSELETKKTMRLVWVTEGLTKEVTKVIKILDHVADTIQGNLRAPRAKERNHIRSHP